MTTQNPGRERPGRRDLVDVVGVDLLEFRIARIRVILARGNTHWFGVCGHFHQFVIRNSIAGRKQGRGTEAACK